MDINAKNILETYINFVMPKKELTKERLKGFFEKNRAELIPQAQNFYIEGEDGYFDATQLRVNYHEKTDGSLDIDYDLLDLSLSPYFKNYLADLQEKLDHGDNISEELNAQSENIQKNLKENLNFKEPLKIHSMSEDEKKSILDDAIKEKKAGILLILSAL